MSDGVLSEAEEKFLQAIVNDFTSTDTLARRGARTRMSNFSGGLPEVKAATATTRLVQGLARKSYRFQLGMAVALATLPQPVAKAVAPKVRAELTTALVAPAGQDPTLGLQLRAALSKMPKA